MKKFFMNIRSVVATTALTALLASSMVSCSYDDTKIWNEIDKIKQESTRRIVKAEDEARQSEVTIKIYQDTWKEKNQMIEKTKTKLTKDVKQHLQTVVGHADTFKQRDQIYEQSSNQLDGLY